MTRIIYLFGIVLLTTLPNYLLADFSSAIRAYNGQRYETAFHEFKRLAELGDGPSQENLAAMYANGEFVQTNVLEAWAWCTLANQQNPDVSTLCDKLFHRLSEQEKKQSQQRFDELSAQFGREAIASKLLPVVTTTAAECSAEIEEEAKPARFKNAKYPKRAMAWHAEALVCVVYYLKKDGSPGYIKATSAKAYLQSDKNSSQPQLLDDFIENTIDAMKTSTFLAPADEQLRQIPKSLCREFSLLSSNSSNSDEGEQSKAEKESAALIKLYQEDPQNADVLFKVARKFETTSLQFSAAKRYQQAQSFREMASKTFVQSAIHGSATAQYRVGVDLLTGNYCAKDSGKGLFWLTLAAQQGDSRAQYLLASRLLRGDGVQQQTEKGLAWLKSAADSGHKQAKLDYALHQLNHNGDLDEVVKYLPARIDEHDIGQLEASARLAARRDNFTQAVEYQTKVVEIAKESEFELEARERALQVYKTQMIKSAQP